MVQEDKLKVHKDLILMMKKNHIGLTKIVREIDPLTQNVLIDLKVKIVMKKRELLVALVLMKHHLKVLTNSSMFTIRMI